ncbi:MGMT family protein [Sporobolomyces koalae]|uniref:MGMT family protein n=1 Tax=Sporobolomyces koalae TaxID=500713 RepID=UPI00317BCA34
MPARRTRADVDDGDDAREPFRQTFHEEVYRTVRRIPEGRVASYGTIAKLVGHPRHSRMVGTALKCLPMSMSSPYLPPAPRSSSGDSSSSATSSATFPGSTLANGLAAVEEEYIQPAPEPNPDWVPWHRVVNSTGVISPRGNDRAVQRQADYLIAEGVVVTDGARNGGGAGNREAERPGNIGAVGGVDAFGLGGVSGGRVSMSTYSWSG